MKGGNRINRSNWKKVTAKSSVPCTSIHGVKEIDRQIKENGVYYEQWRLVYEPEYKYTDGTPPDPGGYIFREINHNGGISGRHKTYRQAIWFAIREHIEISLTID